MSKRYVIRYRYPGTANGSPVGIVYALDIAHLSGRGAWSYVKDPREATMFDSEEAAERVIDGKHWPEARVEELLADLVISL
jgi:hypothetical protein